ncbi:MAG: S1 family peptidase [Ignavibacterium sp.]|uniref:S1 family peptidase n=1 Tax=Ignavibacterium sp. TaxID=2651167 RepID=UPI0040496DBE
MNNLKRALVFTLVLITAIFFLSCSSVSYDSIYPTLKDGRYDSEFPSRSTSAELQKISETIQRIIASAFYRVYIFDESNNYTIEDLAKEKIQKLAAREILIDNSSSGTALVIYSENGNVALLTCSHTINFPDTLIVYKSDERGNATNYIESVSLKERHVIYVAGFPEGSTVDVLIDDPKSDLAILGRKYGTQSGIRFPYFNFKLGNAKDLEWGTFVYLMGYPINNKMITKGIVSSPNKDEIGSFLVDAVINPGFSGGIVLAIRDGVPNFELVGIVHSVPEEKEDMLYPDITDKAAKYNPVIPYKGDIYVKKHSSLRYGIARIVPVEAFKKLLEEKKEYLSKEGFPIFQ